MVGDHVASFGDLGSAGNAPQTPVDDALSG